MVTVVDGVTHLSEPYRRLFLRNAFILLNDSQQAAAGRLFHYDVEASVRLD